MYADKVTAAMDAAIGETERRRKIQEAYNQAHGIVPKTIVKNIHDLIEITKAEREKEIARLEKEMKAAARMMEYEYAAILRDRIVELRGQK